MFTSKHYVNKTYGNHMLSRIVTGYNVTTIDCGSTVNSGYKGTEVTLIDQTPAGSGFDHWNITGATLTGNNFILNNDVTAQGIYTALPTTGQITVSPSNIGPSRQYLIPLAYNAGANRSIVASTTDTDFGWQGGNNSGSMNASYVETTNAGKCINSANHTIKVSAQITAGYLETWTAYMASNKSTRWRYRLAGMTLTTGQVFDLPPFIISYNYTGFGNSYDRVYGGSTAYHPSTYQSRWSYEQGKDGTLLTANIPAGYVPVIIASYVDGDNGTYNNGSAYLNYTWKYTAEL